jgi:hypothetical protein
MNRYDIEFVKYVIAFLLVAGTGMSAFWLWLRSRARPLADVDRMVEALRADHEQVQAELAARIAELEERVDFAERRLIEQPRASRSPQSPVRTPV